MAYGKRNYQKMAKKALSKPRSKTAYKTASVPLKIKKYVKSTIDRQTEDKHDILNVWTNVSCLQNGFDSTSTNQGLTSGSIIPIIPQGPAVDNRIGNRINVKSLQARLTLIARPVNPTDNYVAGLPFYVRVVFYNRKDSLTNFTNNTILDFGGINAPFSGALESLLLKYNKDTFNIVKSMTFKMAPSQAISGSGVSTAENMPNGFASHIFKTINLKCPKRFQYDDTAAQPNFRLYCAIGIVNADNSLVLPATTGYRLRVSMTSHLTYEDA